MATALSAILVENSGVTGLLYFSDTSRSIHQQTLLVLLQFIPRVWSHVTSSIITILVHASMVSCLEQLQLSPSWSLFLPSTPL